MSLSEWVSDNSRTLLLLGAGYVGYVEIGGGQYPTLPESSGLAVVVALAVAGVGYIAAGKIEGLLPDDEGIYLVAFDASDDTGGSLWELSEDKFEDLEVYAGTLFQWPGTSKRVYEVREYRPEDNVAVGNWRESVAGSELAGEALVVDAMEEIQELRSVFEPESQKYRILKRRLRGVARKMDRRRAEDQQSILDENLTPGFNDDNQVTVSDVIQDEIPEELRPDSMSNDDGAAVEDEPGEHFAGFELLDEPEPTEPLQND